MDSFRYGVEAIQPLIGNREDIARFDMAMVLTGRDVDLDSIYQSTTSDSPQFSSDDCQTLTMWAWSREAKHIEFASPSVEHDVLEGAKWLAFEYVSDPPLIQSENIHVKLARMSVAIAASTFSTDKTGRKLIVKRSHVADATKFLHYLYGKESFGYHRMSQLRLMRKDLAVANMDEAKRWLQENPQLTSFLSEMGSTFRRDMMETALNLGQEEARAITNQLFNWKLLGMDTNMVEVRPELHQIIREIESESVDE
jgi:hypothetical protein